LFPFFSHHSVNNKEIAKIYQAFFPKDKVIVADAHQYLLDHFKEFDFIWSSPPCPTHSRARFWAHAKKNPIYPDMRLYQEILILKHLFKGKYVIENVKPYYKILIEAQQCSRHLFWSNFPIQNIDFKIHFEPFDKLETIKNKLGFDGLEVKTLNGITNIDKRVILRNCVLPELGKHILDCAMGKIKQQPLF